MRISVFALSRLHRLLPAFVTLLAGLLLAGCGQDTGEKAAGPVIESWGPKETVQGKGFNVQPSGNSAMWIKATGLSDARGYKIKIGEFEAQPAKRTASGVGAVVPDALLKSLGSHRVVLIDDATGGEIFVGTFEVSPAD
jgi:hypothetical protein